MKPPILFEHFQTGCVMGGIVQPCTSAMTRSLREIFGSRGSSDMAEGAAIGVAMMMRGYLGVVTPRPPGNVHVRQRFVLHAAPCEAEPIRTVVTCLSKEIRRERRHVKLDVRGTGADGRAIYTGILNLIWAA